jgi:hypothetical protein
MDYVERSWVLTFAVGIASLALSVTYGVLQAAW